MRNSTNKPNWREQLTKIIAEKSKWTPELSKKMEDENRAAADARQATLVQIAEMLQAEAKAAQDVSLQEKICFELSEMAVFAAHRPDPTPGSLYVLRENVMEFQSGRLDDKIVAFKGDVVFCLRPTANRQYYYDVLHNETVLVFHQTFLREKMEAV